MRAFTPYVCPICASHLPRAASRCFFCDQPLPIYKGKPPRAPARRQPPSTDQAESFRPPRIYVTARDFARLEHLAHLGFAEEAPDALSLLRAELDRAVVCSNDEAPPGVVRMGSTVLLRDDDGQGAAQKIRGALVYPGERHPRLPSIPVSTPLGAAILGLSAGDVMAYGVGEDVRHVVRVLSVHHSAPRPPDLPPGPCAA